MKFALILTSLVLISMSSCGSNKAVTPGIESAKIQKSDAQFDAISGNLVVKNSFGQVIVNATQVTDYEISDTFVGFRKSNGEGELRDATGVLVRSLQGLAEIHVSHTFAIYRLSNGQAEIISSQNYVHVKEAFNAKKILLNESCAAYLTQNGIAEFIGNSQQSIKMESSVRDIALTEQAAMTLRLDQNALIFDFNSVPIRALSNVVEIQGAQATIAFRDISGHLELIDSSGRTTLSSFEQVLKFRILKNVSAYQFMNGSGEVFVRSTGKKYSYSQVVELNSSDGIIGIRSANKTANFFNADGILIASSLVGVRSIGVSKQNASYCVDFDHCTVIDQMGNIQTQLNGILTLSFSDRYRAQIRTNGTGTLTDDRGALIYEGGVKNIQTSKSFAVVVTPTNEVQGYLNGGQSLFSAGGAGPVQIGISDQLVGYSVQGTTEVFNSNGIQLGSFGSTYNFRILAGHAAFIDQTGALQVMNSTGNIILGERNVISYDLREDRITVTTTTSHFETFLGY